jgi:hypothetical protein
MALTLAGCNNGAEQERLRQEMEQLSTISAEKDSLLQQVAENAQLMSEISTELSKVKDRRAGMVVSPESRLQMSRDSILAAIRELAARVDDSETRLEQSQRRIRGLSNVSDSLRTSVTAFEKTISDFQTVIDNQKVTITSLADQVNALMAENVRLVAQNEMLEDTMGVLTEKETTVFYAVGTKDDLVDRGVVVEQGGSRVLFIFGKRGKTLVPAIDLPDSAFVAINKREVLEIPLPNPDKDYRIASRQNLMYLAEPPNEDGKFRGALRIADPDAFWEASPYLIIVES